MLLKSSRIKSVEYNDSTDVLTVEFVKGGKYKYYSVPEEIYNAITHTNSPGNYFDSFIKNKFHYKKA